MGKKNVDERERKRRGFPREWLQPQHAGECCVVAINNDPASAVAQHYVCAVPQRNTRRNNSVVREAGLRRICFSCPAMTVNRPSIPHGPKPFPVDIRHNAKIGREKLAVWAAGRTRI